MISVNNIDKEFSARPLFKGVSFVINPNDKIALVGKNGAGKTTLLKMFAGIDKPTSGSIDIPKGITIGYLPQQMQLSDDTTLVEETRKAFSSRIAEEKELAEITSVFAERTDYDSPSYQEMLDKMTTLQERIDLFGSPASMEAELERTLLGLGFKRSDFLRSTSEFSGGWRMRIELAKILLQHPDVMLLDEPTNHLDIESIQWLEQFLATKAKAVLLVSHDRAFLDNVTKRTIEISCGKIYDYKASYSHFKELRKERVEQQRRAYENQQKQIAEIKDFIERFRYKPTKSNQVQSRIKQLEKIVPIEIDEVDNSRLHLRFPPAERSGDFPVTAENVAKSYGEHQVFANATFTIRRGEKVAFVGKNGEGKSTLVKCIMQEIPFDGMLKIGHNIKIGYFAQNQASLLDGDITVFDTIDRVATGPIRTRIRDILGAFMFGGEAADKYVKVLSGGEKTRLAMIKLLLQPVNFLILDEPTNHLDMTTKDVLKEAIRNFDGTVIIVSHDREFMDGLVEKVYEFGNGRVVEHLGSISDFLHRRQLDSLSELELSKKQSAYNKNQNQSVSVIKENVNSENRNSTENVKKKTLSYAEQKEHDKIIRKLEKAVKQAEEEIAMLEQQQQELENKIAQGDASTETLNQYQASTIKLENAMSIWEIAQQDLDNFKNENI